MKRIMTKMEDKYLMYEYTFPGQHKGITTPEQYTRAMAIIRKLRKYEYDNHFTYWLKTTAKLNDQQIEDLINRSKKIIEDAIKEYARVNAQTENINIMGGVVKTFLLIPE